MLTSEGFEQLVQDARRLLLGRAPVTISYTDRKNLAANIEANAEVIAQEVARGGNIYALWAREDDVDPWATMYIGQRTQQFIAERLRQHLFHTPARTQSKIHKVTELVQQNWQIGITVILVSPDPVRLAVEDQLIYLNTDAATDLPWNTKGRNVGLTRATTFGNS